MRKILIKETVSFLLFMLIGRVIWEFDEDFNPLTWFYWAVFWFVFWFAIDFWKLKRYKNCKIPEGKDAQELVIVSPDRDWGMMTMNLCVQDDLKNGWVVHSASVKRKWIFFGDYVFKTILIKDVS